MMATRFKVVVSIVVLSLALSACSFFGFKEDPIPEGTSSVAGIVRYVDEFPVGDAEVILADQSIAAQANGTFAFDAIDNGRYTLEIVKNGTVIHEEPVVVDQDIAGLIVSVGTNLLEDGSFEGVAPGEEPTGAWGVFQDNKAHSTETTVDNTRARTGMNSVRVHGVRKDGERPRSTVRIFPEIEGGATYRVVAWVYADGDEVKVPTNPPLTDDLFFVRLRFFEEETDRKTITIGNDLENIVLASSGDTYRPNGQTMVRFYPEVWQAGAWTRIYAEFVVPDNSDEMQIELFYSNFWDDPDEGTLWWDDASLVRID